MMNPSQKDRGGQAERVMAGKWPVRNKDLIGFWATRGAGEPQHDPIPIHLQLAIG